MTKTTTARSYGWLPDTPDQRDFLVAVAAPVPLPATVSLRAGMPPVYDQGQLGSCTANALAAAFDYDRALQSKPFMNPSRLFVYYNERVMEGTVQSDAGAMIRDGVKTLKNSGVPPETSWPYKIKKFAAKPTAAAFKAATKNEALSYARVPAVESMIQQVLAQGRPVVIGFTVYESFESAAVAATGIMPMPAAGEQALGGHAVLVVGYKSINGQLHFEVRNSWGPGWGDAGHFWMPAQYLTNPHLSSDFWAVQTVVTA